MNETASSKWNSGPPLRPTNGTIFFLHHGVEGALRHFAVRIGHQLHEPAWRDLPRQAEAVLAPAADALGAAVVDDAVPVAVGLRLVLGVDHERDRFVEVELGAAVETNERHAENGELDGEHVPLLAGGKIAGRTQDLADAAVGKGGGVELGSLLGVLVEPEACRDTVFHPGLRSEKLRLCRKFCAPRAQVGAVTGAAG